MKYTALQSVSRDTIRDVAFACGILSSLVYVGRDLAAWLTYPGYDFVNQVVSELSAIGVHSRGVDIAMGRLYGALLTAFGTGLIFFAGNRRGLRAAGVLLAAGAVFGWFWPPMHARGSPATLTDTLHIAWTAGWLLLTMAAMFCAGAALGKRFLYYTAATALAMLLFGGLTGLQGARLAANLSTPGIGIYERIGIGAFLLWVVVLARTARRGSIPGPTNV